ncbi:helix-turn-helix domain-containing protein [Crossiella sp. NPDC003009]
MSSATNAKKRRKYRPTLVGAARESVADRIAILMGHQGKTLREAAAMCGIGYTVAHNLARERGLAKPRLTSAERAKVAADCKRLYLSGLTLAEVVARVPVGYGTVRGMLSELGIAMRPRNYLGGRARGERL